MNTLLAWRPWAVATLAATLFLTNLGTARLFDEDEPKNARCGAEMHEAGEWVVPTYNGELRSHKPVLLYWAMRLSYGLLGVNEFSARLPSALAGIAIAVMCYHLARLLFDRTTGLVAAATLSAALMFAVLMRASTPDGVLMISTTAALLSFVAGVSARRGGSFSGADGRGPALASIVLPLPHAVAMYTAMGLAVLAKGPIGVLLPLWAVCLYGLFGEPVAQRSDPAAPAWRRGLGWFFSSVAPARWWLGARSVRLPLGLLIVALVAGPWYAAVSVRTGGDWLTGFLGTHNVGRFAGAMEGHDGRPFYAAYYLVTFLVGFFPGSCFLPVAAVGALARTRSGDPQARSYAFALAVVGAWLSVFSAAATKLPNYVIPCYVGLATLTAAWLVAQARRLETAPTRSPLRTWLAAGLASSVAVGLVLTVALAAVSALLMGGSPLLGLVGLAPLAGGAVGLGLLSTGDARRAVGSFVGGAVAFTLLAVTVVAPAASPFRDGPEIADRVAELEAALGRPLIVATHRYTNPSVVWELRRQVDSLDANETRALLAQPGAVVAMSDEAYEEIRPQLPPGVTKLADQGRFMRRERRVVLVGGVGLLAYVPHPTSLR